MEIGLRRIMRGKGSILYQIGIVGNFGHILAA
jgi:hypothetical protein